MESEKSLKEDWLLWLLLGVAFVFLLGYWFILPGADMDKEGPQWLFADVPAQSIKAIRRYERDDLQLELIRSAKGSGWTLRTPENIETDDEAIDRRVDGLRTPQITRRFKAQPDSDYGFDRSDTRIQIVVNESTHDLYFGEESPTRNGFYVRYGSDRRAPVFLMPKSARSTLDLSLFDVRNKQLFDENLGSITAFELRTDQGRMLYREEEGTWILSEPKKQSLNDTQNRSLEASLSSIRGLRADQFYDGEKPSEFTPERSKLILRTGERERVLTIGSTKDGQRLVRVNNRSVIAVGQDPVSVLADLPAKPSGWPEGQSSTEETETTPKKNFPKQIQQMKSKSSPRSQ